MKYFGPLIPVVVGAVVVTVDKFVPGTTSLVAELIIICGFSMLGVKVFRDE